MFRQAADVGHTVAESILAMCYNEGVEVEQSYPLAAPWGRKAADQGDAEAQFLVGSRGLHSSTFQLNLSALCGIGGARRGCVTRVEGVLGGVRG